MTASGAVRPRLVIREIGADDRCGLDVIAALHMELLGFGTMAALGPEFVREVCYRANMCAGVLWVFLAEIDGEPAGFLAVTPFSVTFHRSGLSGHLWLAGWQSLKALARNPKRIVALWKSLRELSTRRNELDRVEHDLGEIVCIAGRPQYLAPKFMRASGIRLSELLVRHGATYLRRAGRDAMRMLVGAGNKPVLMLYHLLGAHFRDYELGGTPVVEVAFDLTDGRLAAASALPQIWQESSPVAAGDDWRTYWEQIDEGKKVFRVEAVDYIARLLRWVPVRPTDRALDFGCGFGFVAELLARHVGTLALWDGAASVRRSALARTAHLAKIEYADLSRAEAFDGNAQYDVITVHSVVQYMSPVEIQGWLVRWRRLLRKGGRLVISDLLQPSTTAVSELAGYLLFALRNGFFWDALIEGISEIGRYRKARTARPLTLVTPEMLSKWGTATGFEIERLAENLSYRRSRRTLILRAPH